MYSADQLRIRAAVKADVPRIREMIEGLAEYERLRNECIATDALLDRALFGERRYAEVVIAEEVNGGDNPTTSSVGFALFFHNFSTFLARPGLYLEDLYVLPAKRNRGVGVALLAHLAQVAIDRECGRLEWSVLKWNTDAIRFYESLGASPQTEWTVYRLTADALHHVASRGLT